MRLVWLLSLSLAMTVLPLLYWQESSNAAPLPVVGELVAAPTAGFPHDLHVSQLWLDQPEVARDCRGCHVFQEDGSEMPAEESCVKCHYDLPDGKNSIEVVGKIANIPRTYPTFDHHDHKSADCKSCHAPVDDGTESVPFQMFVPRGLGWCVKCHDPSSADRPAKDGATNHAAFQKTMNANPVMQDHANAEFRHSDHLSASELSDASTCNRCHTSMADASANIGEKVFRSIDCDACHVDANGKGLGFSTKSRDFKSGADLSFYHKDHTGAALEAKSKTLKSSCLTCHELGKTEGREISDYPIRRGFDKFEQCSRCHEEEGMDWQGEAVTWRIEDHAQYGTKNSAGNDCQGCHSFDSTDKMKDTRPHHSIDRKRPSEFAITVQAHPHITGPASTKHADCSKCHIAQAAKIPSRIQSKTFRHESHLGKDASAKDCLTCHQADKSKMGMMETKGHDAMTLSYSESACLNCHKGIEELKASSYKADSRSVVLFDHNDHFGKASKNIACNECHQDKATKDHEFSYAENVVSCLKCHDHGEHKADTDQKDQAYVASCTACHQKHNDGWMPAIGKDRTSSRVDIHGIKGAQFHPLPDNQKCSECHLEGMTWEKSVDNLKDQVLSSPQGYEKGQFHSAHRESESSKPSYCFSCHWNNFNAIRVDVSSAVKQGVITDISGLPHSKRSNPEKIRSVLGNEMQGYPGIQK